MEARVKDILSWYDSDKPRPLEFLSTVMKISSGGLK